MIEEFKVISEFCCNGKQIVIIAGKLPGFLEGGIAQSSILQPDQGRIFKKYQKVTKNIRFNPGKICRKNRLTAKKSD